MAEYSNELTIVKVNDGTSGRGIESTTITYGVSNSANTEPSSWSSDPPTSLAEGSWLWTKTVITYSTGQPTTSYSKAYIGTDGTDGKDGAAGKDGKDGTSISITSKSVKYQVGTSGTVAPTGTWLDDVPTVADGRYLWTQTIVNYSDGTSTTAYSVSYKAQNGTNGTSPTVTSTVIRYAQSTNGSNPPATESDWKTTPPAAVAGQYMWTRTVITYSDNATSTSYSVAYNGTNGTNGTNGQDGRSITGVTAYFAISNSDLTPPQDGWQTTALAPTIESPFLWTYEVISYSDTTTSQTESRVIGTYSISNDVYELATNVTSVYKFYEDDSLEFSPGIVSYHVNQLTDNGKVRVDLTGLTIQYDIIPYLVDLKSLFNDVYIRNESNQLVKLNSVVYTDNLETESNKKISESINIEILATAIGYTSTGAALSGEVAANFEILQNQLKNETVNLFATVSRQEGENVEALAYHLMNITFGLSIDMAQFRVLSNRIEAAVNASKLTFDADTGLTIMNGGIRILGGDDGTTELLKYNPDSRSLNIVGSGTFTGSIYANNGIFTGEVHATSGDFNGRVTATSGSFTGEIVASSGTIGGFIIDSNSLQSIAKNNNDQSLIQLNGVNGSAYVENLEIATGAKITDYVTIGSSIIRANSEQDNTFIQTDNFKLSHDGIIQLGNLTLNGENSTFTGDNFSITPDWSYFNNVGISGKITTSVFETNHVQSVGGSMLFRPSYHIEKYTPNGTTATIQIEDSLGSASETKVGNLVKLVDSSGILSTTMYSITAINENIITIEAQSGNVQEDAYIFIDFGDESTLLIGINSQYSKNDILLPRGLTISPVQRENNQVYPALFLGDLSTSGIQYDSTTMSGYGLYSDNVYLRGSLTTVTSIPVNENTEALYYAGINTQSMARPDQNKFTNHDTSPIIFWGGATGTNASNISNAPFFITQNGSLYAAQGLFEGAIITRSKIEAAEIYAARIYGTNDSDYGLAIYDAPPTETGLTSQHNGIVFYDSADETSPTELLRIDPVSIKSHGYDFISFNNGVEIISDISRAEHFYSSKLLNESFLNITDTHIYTSTYNNNDLINNGYIEFNSNQLGIVIGSGEVNASRIVTITSTNVDIDGSGSITNNFVLGNNQMKYTPNGTSGYDLYVY